MRTPSRTLADPAPAAPAADGEILRRLAGTAVARLHLGAAAVVLQDADAPYHVEGAPAPRQVLLGVILHHRAALRQAPPGAVSVLGPIDPSTAYADASLALVGLALEGEPLGTLLALHPRAWSLGETAALETLAHAALAELGWHRERQARQRAEERLALLERALQAVDLGVTITNAAGHIVFTNPAEARMHGYGVDELIGRAARSLGLAQPALLGELVVGLFANGLGGERFAHRCERLLVGTDDVGKGALPDIGGVFRQRGHAVLRRVGDRAGRVLLDDAHGTHPYFLCARLERVRVGIAELGKDVQQIRARGSGREGRIRCHHSSYR